MKKIYDLTCSEKPEAIETYSDFMAIVRQLRRDCPWDREQTHESVKHLLIEETYEALEAIDEENWEELQQELGDLLLHVAFHSLIGEKNGTFTMKEVIEKETEKLVRRHPHVFGDVDVEDASEVVQNWEQIKIAKEEKKSVLGGVPRQLPALLRAYRVQEKAAGVGFDFPVREGAWEKVREEMEEFFEMVEAGAPYQKVEDELGDLLFGLVNYARYVGVNPENALNRTNDKFARRFLHIERRLEENGLDLNQVDLEIMDQYWDEAKELGL